MPVRGAGYTDHCRLPSDLCTFAYYSECLPAIPRTILRTAPGIWAALPRAGHQPYMSCLFNNISHVVPLLTALIRGLNHLVLSPLTNVPRPALAILTHYFGAQQHRPEAAGTAGYDGVAFAHSRNRLRFKSQSLEYASRSPRMLPPQPRVCDVSGTLHLAIH